MRLVALLSWYEEDPRWLTEMVDSLPKAGVDHLIALDGAYALFPGATPQSHPSNAVAIAKACDRYGITHTILAPEEVWEGNEVEKRSALFELGEQVTTEDDWYIVMDADELILDAPNLKGQLAATDCDVARGIFNEERGDPLVLVGKPRNKDHFPIRMMFRAIRGLRVKHNHWTYVTPDGRKLWGQNKRKLAPALDTDLQILHRTELRETARRVDQHHYYETRDEAKVEIGPCDYCGVPGIRSLATGWEPSDEGDGLYVADYVYVCAECLPKVRRQNDIDLLRLGVDPISLLPLPPVYEADQMSEDDLAALGQTLRTQHHLSPHQRQPAMAR